MILNRKKIRSVHLIGIGGMGMSSLAFFLKFKNLKISGSDIGKDPVIKKLKKIGCDIYPTHSPENIKDPDLVIYSSAITQANPELVKAKKRKISILKRGQALGFFTDKMKNITITGCHGKSTTTSISHLILNNSNIKPTAFMGAEDRIIKSNFYAGNSKFSIIEGDESDNSFNEINSYMSLVTNIDNDHLDFYKTKSKLISAFRRFIVNTKKKSIINGDSEMLNKLVETLPKDGIIKFGKGLNESNDYSFEIVKNNYSIIEVFKKRTRIGIFRSKLSGEYNCYNLAGSIILALELGVSPKEIQSCTVKCRAPVRRFETIANNKNVKIIDDYAHHPTAIKSVRKNIEENYLKEEVILIFQPHRFSRTKILLKDFIEELSKWNNLYLVDIYSAFEKENIDVSNLFSEIKKKNPRAIFYKNKKILINKIISKLKYKKYTILTMGAGDIRDVGIELKKKV